MDKYCTVILTAAGSGSRFGSAYPKQYTVIKGKTILEHTIDIFLSMSIVRQICVIVAKDDNYISKIVESSYKDLKKIKMMPVGGITRSNSIYNCLSNLDCKTNDWVMIHDVARCCTKSKDILRMFDELKQDPVGGILALPATDTIKYSNDGIFIDKTIPRSSVFQAQTPQMFRYGVIVDAMKSCDLNMITDDASCVELSGLPVRMIMGCASNIKITFPQDIELAEIILGRV